MKHIQDRWGTRRIGLLALALFLLLILVLLLALRGCTPRGIYEGKIQSAIDANRPLEPVCIVELLSVDGNGDGVPDYQQLGEIEPRTDYDREVLAALQWIKENLNSLDVPEPEEPAKTPPANGGEASSETSQPPLSQPEREGQKEPLPDSSEDNERQSRPASGSSLSPAAPDSSGPASSASNEPESSETDTGWSPANHTPAAPFVTGIRIEEPPTKTEYIEGESFDPAGIRLVMLLSNGAAKPVTAFQYPTEPLTLGTTAVPVSMPTGTKTFTATVAVTVREKSLLDILVTPERDYIEGQTPKPEDFTISGEYDNGKTEPVPDARIEVPGKPLVAGRTEIEITVTVGDRAETIAVPIAVRPKSPVELIVTHGPNRLDYIAGQAFDPAGITAMVRYDNGFLSDITDFQASPGRLGAGQSAAEISYTENGVTVTAQIRITVRPESLVEASISTLPHKTDYPEGVPFVPDGLVLECEYDNGKTERRTDYVYGDTLLSLGMTEFPVAITHRDVTLFVEVPITVRPTVPETVSVRAYPDDLIQYAGTKLDLSGMELEISYDNGTSAAVPATDSRVELSNGKRHFDRIDPVTGLVEYPLADCAFTDNGVTVRGTEAPGSSRLRITPYLAQLTLCLSDEAPYYKVGHPIGPTGLTVRFDYLGGGTAETAPCDPNSPEDEVVRLLSSGLARLEYEETTATNDGAEDKPVKISLVPSPKFLDTQASAVRVQVAPLLPDKLEVVTPPAKTEYVNDEAFTSEGMKLQAVMNNGEIRELAPGSPGIETGYDAGAGFIPMPEGSFIRKHQNETNLVRYTYNGKTVSVPFPLSIVDEVPVRLTRRGDFTGKAFTENLPFTPGEIGYTVLLSNGKTLEIPYGNAVHEAPAPGQPASTEQQGRTAQASPAPGEKLVAGSNAAYGENTARFSFTMNGETVEDEFSYELLHRLVESIEAAPTKPYDHGGEIKPADFRVTLHWNNGETSEADPENVTVSRSNAENNSLLQTVNAVTIGVRGLRTIGSPTAAVSIMVNAPVPTSLQITQPPAKTQYVNGTHFDPAGLELAAGYSNGASSGLLPGSAGLSIDTAGELAFGQTAVTIHYTYNGVTVSVPVPITVIHETPATLQIVSPPVKTSYVVGNALDLTGLSLQATLTNGKTITFPYNGAGVACSPAQGAILNATDKTVTVSYTLWGVTKQAAQVLSISQYVTCPSCYGSGSRTCGSCGGDGRVTATCSSCGGSGRGAEIWVCGKCGTTTTGSRPGSVHSPCAPEGGWYSGGYENCSSCRGSGSKTSSCSSCGGSGDRTCSTCGGSGKVLAGVRNAVSLSDELPECAGCIPDEPEEQPFQAVTLGSEDGTATTSDSVTIPVDVYYALPEGEADPANAIYFVRFSDGGRIRFNGPDGVMELSYLDERLHLTYRDNGRWVTRIYPRGLH